jgi:predicted nuclease with TOPRIM domain
VQKEVEKAKKKNKKNEETISRLSKLKIENGQFNEFKNNALNERIHTIQEELTKLLGTFGLHEFYVIEDRGREKFGVSPEIEFKDPTGLIKSISTKIEKFDPREIIWDIEKNPKSDPLKTIHAAHSTYC